MSVEPLIIDVEDLHVRFRDYGAQRVSLARRTYHFFKPKAYFDALNNINLQVRQGDSLFLIGRNGAGKTTLLRVLSRTLMPDTGHVRIWGEISAFLSMGLGFRPEFNAYENIALSLTFFGCDEKEIVELTKDIADFTQLGNFLDAPVKTYSAGMRARLAFAIATSIEPEILLMDEVINAGDQNFRDRCNEKIAEFMQKAKAIVVATHNMNQARNIANRVVWIEKGQIQFDGDPIEGVKRYKNFIKQIKNNPFYDLENK